MSCAAPDFYYPSEAERSGNNEPVARATKPFRSLVATRYSYGVASQTHTALSSSSFEIAVYADVRIAVFPLDLPFKKLASRVADEYVATLFKFPVEVK